jgi:hypothetical protein
MKAKQAAGMSQAQDNKDEYSLCQEYIMAVAFHYDPSLRMCRESGRIAWNFKLKLI